MKILYKIKQIKVSAFIKHKNADTLKIFEQKISNDDFYRV